MEKFLFITCLTPKSHLTDLRAELHRKYLDALLKQTNKKWLVFLLGEEEKTDGNLHYIKCSSKTKEDKLLEIFEKLKTLPVKPEFIIRLDDDDLISEDILERVEAHENDFDVFTDKYQSMFDVYSGKSLVKDYPWWPSTIIMRYNDAMTLHKDFENKPLYACPHDLVFHNYFKNRKIFYSRKEAPIYTRVFSPTSISFNLFNGDLDINKYNKYLHTYGFWEFLPDSYSCMLRKIYSPIALKHFKKEYKDRFLPFYNILYFLNFQYRTFITRLFNKAYQFK